LRTRASLRRADEAAVTALRRFGAALASPAVRLSRWERGRPPGVVRSVTASPRLVAALAGVVVVGAAAVHLDRFPTDGAEVVAAPATPAEVGPPAGVDLEAYTDERHRALRDLGDVADPLRAVVSFARLLPLDALPLPDEVTREQVQLLLPGEIVPRELPADGAATAVDGLVREGRDDLDQEIAELEQLLAEDLGDPGFEEEFTAQLERLREVRDGAGGDARIVFAVVVVAPATALQQLVDEPGIRLVDPAGAEATTRATRLVGVQPLDPA
jgi:hypothetical protein